MKTNAAPYVSTTNACKLCKPLGACLAFRGIEGAVPYLHGSQGCATYMRRYIISHFREPMDIASSSLGEKHAVYGGGPNLKLGIRNVMTKYRAGLIGIATTCLTETIGDDVPGIVAEFKREFSDLLNQHGDPEIVTVATPSYSGSHMEGFHAAVKASVKQLAQAGPKHQGVGLFPGFVSPADIRYLKEVLDDFGISATILPDISLTLDGPALDEYEKVPRGGTPVEEIKSLGGAKAAIEFGRTLSKNVTAGGLLEEEYDVPLHSLGTPIGLRESDCFFSVLEEISGRAIPERHALERGRLIDSFVDGHKYVAGKRAVVYGEADLVVGLTSFLAEIGIKPVLCATGSRTGRFEQSIHAVLDEFDIELPVIRDGMDFYEIAEEAEELHPDLLVGNSKGYHLARRWNVPLIRVGFPIHDRFGGHRTLHVGYRGAQSIFDSVVNALIERKQEQSPVGYTYI
ncbi:MAG: nitrogenase [Desulfomonile tiedjei]|nr:nitrogenase [Desulfomonile tiedjei]